MSSNYLENNRRIVIHPYYLSGGTESASSSSTSNSNTNSGTTAIAIPVISSLSSTPRAGTTSEDHFPVPNPTSRPAKKIGVPTKKRPSSSFNSRSSSNDVTLDTADSFSKKARMASRGQQNTGTSSSSSSTLNGPSVDGILHSSPNNDSSLHAMARSHVSQNLRKERRIPLGRALRDKNSSSSTTNNFSVNSDAISIIQNSNNQLIALRKSMNALRAEVGALSEEVASLKRKIKRFRAKNDEAHSHLDTDITALQRYQERAHRTNVQFHKLTGNRLQNFRSDMDRFEQNMNNALQNENDESSVRSGSRSRSPSDDESSIRRSRSRSPSNDESSIRRSRSRSPSNDESSVRSRSSERPSDNESVHNGSPQGNSPETSPQDHEGDESGAHETNSNVSTPLSYIHRTPQDNDNDLDDEPDASNAPLHSPLPQAAREVMGLLPNPNLQPLAPDHNANSLVSLLDPSHLETPRTRFANGVLRTPQTPANPSNQ